jgi:tRNA pseudouridine55 synthase
VDGILIIDKPSGMTSHDVVDFVRRRFGIKKVGHAGTLDPMATGVLVLLLGKATKVSARFMNEDKEYEATLTLGATTDTGDSEGKIISSTEKFSFNLAEVEEVFKVFQGEIDQVPPMVSAIRHQGKRLYQLARKGINVERKPRRVKIYRLEITRFNLPNISFCLKCSKGTYVRALCQEIGERLGCGGHQSSLRRLCSGRFRIQEAVTFDELRKMSRAELEKIIIK